MRNLSAQVNTGYLKSCLKNTKYYVANIEKYDGG